MSAFYGVLLMFIAGLYSVNSLAQEPLSAELSAAPEPAPPAVLNAQRPPPTGRNVLAAKAAQLGLNADQLIDLSTPAEHFSALFLAANTAQAHGMVILLPGSEETFDWPVTIGPLRRKLPDAGWHTLSLNLPTAPAIGLPAGQSIAEPVAEQIIVYAPMPAEFESPGIDEPEPIEAEPEPADETAEESIAEDPLSEDTPTATFATIAPPSKPKPMPLPDYPQRISNFIDAAIAHAQTLNAAEIILLGHHEGAHWALDYAAKNATSSPIPMRIALIAPRSSDFLNVSYENLIEANTRHLADFYYKNHAAEQKAAQQRLYASRRANVQHYHQIALTTASGVQNIEQERLFRRVKGWLNKP